MIAAGFLPTFVTVDVGEMLDVGLPPLTIDGALHPLDHVAQVVESPAEVDRRVADCERRGGVIVEPPYVFPDGVCAESLSWPFHKYMATVQTAHGLLVISAPLADGDQLSAHLARFGPSVPHHVAIPVPQIVPATTAWQARGWCAGPIIDDGALAQVFLVQPMSAQLVELISRKDPADLATFSCGNVAALSRAEADIRTEAPAS
jgi:hypothetical protein